MRCSCWHLSGAPSVHDQHAECAVNDSNLVTWKCEASAGTEAQWAGRNTL